MKEVANKKIYNRRIKINRIEGIQEFIDMREAEEQNERL